ncbi:MAG: Cof-type HAD-IIB family hydrolase [Terriglobia bacterium]|nr:Cof-type HAD-IIB family hydrolase [Terriglobia bacterium]
MARSPDGTIYNMLVAIRLIAIDIDGTLLDPRFQVSTANLETLARAHNQSIEVVLVTGRRHTFALPVANALGFEVTLISSNGAVTRSSNGELFHDDPLPADVALRLLQYMSGFRSNTVLTFDREGKGAIVIESADELNLSIQKWMEKNAQWIDRVIPLEDAITEDPIQMMFCGSISRMMAAQKTLIECEFAGEFTVLRTQYDHRNLCMLDVLNQGCSKGHALERWATHRGFTRDEVMAIGDNFNDVEMLQFAGLPVLMGNACDELKQNGWTLTLGNDESGVAWAVEKILESQ